MMAEAQEGDEIFVYMGGQQEVPERVKRARIHQSVNIIRRGAFQNREHLISVEFHDDIEIIEEDAFICCVSLSASIKLLGIRIIKAMAFYHCSGLTGVEFGDTLETIEAQAFCYCNALKNITMPHVKTIGKSAFFYCKQLMDLELPEELETMGEGAFKFCESMGRIALPLKNNLIQDDAFHHCTNLTSVDLVGGIHSSVASLHLESWRNEMIGEIDLINQVLPNTESWVKTQAIRSWMSTVILRLDHFKSEHDKLLKETTTLLELALWKANLDGKGGGVLEKEGVRTTRGKLKKARKEICVTSGASIVIKNVLPFLTLFQ